MIAPSQSCSNRPNLTMGQQKWNTTEKQSTIFQRFGSMTASPSAKPCTYAATYVHTPHATGCTCKRHLHDRERLEGLSTNGLSGKWEVCKWRFSLRNRDAFSCCNQGNFIPSQQPFSTQNFWSIQPQYANTGVSNCADGSMKPSKHVSDILDCLHDWRAVHLETGGIREEWGWESHAHPYGVWKAQTGGNLHHFAPEPPSPTITMGRKEEQDSVVPTCKPAITQISFSSWK